MCEIEADRRTGWTGRCFVLLQAQTGSGSRLLNLVCFGGRIKSTGHAKASCVPERLDNFPDANFRCQSERNCKQLVGFETQTCCLLFSLQAAGASCDNVPPCLHGFPAQTFRHLPVMAPSWLASQVLPLFLIATRQCSYRGKR